MFSSQESVDDGRQITLFPTRLREFEEKNNLVFHHYLSAKNSLRRNSDAPCFGDQYVRRMSMQEDLLDGDDQVFNAMRKIFRRSSIVDPNVQKVRKEVLETRLIPIIFAKLGQEYDTEELRKWIKGQDRNGTGVVDFDGYQRICVHFVKDPEAIERAKTQEFSFENLVSRSESDDDISEGDSEECSEDSQRSEESRED